MGGLQLLPSLPIDTSAKPCLIVYLFIIINLASVRFLMWPRLQKQHQYLSWRLKNSD